MLFELRIQTGSQAQAKLDQYKKDPNTKSYDIKDSSDFSFPIDIDGDGKNERIQMKKEEGCTSYTPRYFFNEDLTKFSNRGRLVQYDTPPLNIFHKDFSLKNATSLPAIPTKVLVGDFDHDGKTDYIFIGAGVYFLFINDGTFKNRKSENLFQPKLLETVPAQKPTVKGIPEYDRTGTIHLSNPQVCSAGNEKLSDEWSKANLGNVKSLLSDGTYRQLESSLPKNFFVGALELTPSWKAKPFKETLEQFGFEVKEDIQNSCWPQDRYEAVVENGHLKQVEENPYGGHTQFLRNSKRELFVTVSEKRIRDLQKENIIKNNQVIDYKTAVEIFSASMGVDSKHVLILPHIGRFVHLDQQVVGVKDGKVLMVKLPADYSNKQDLENWKKAKEMFVSKGFKVSEIELPIRDLEDRRSALNLLMRKDKKGERHYYIPVDPILMVNLDQDSLMDRRKQDTEWKQDNNTCVLQPIYTSAGQETLRSLVFYDPLKIPTHVEAVRKALTSFGVSEGNIHYFFYNGMSGGSIHCRTNLDPL